MEWPPGDVFVHETVSAPDSFEPGQIMIHAGLIDPAAGSLVLKKRYLPNLDNVRLHPEAQYFHGFQPSLE